MISIVGFNVLKDVHLPCASSLSGVIGEIQRFPPNEFVARHAKHPSMQCSYDTGYFNWLTAGCADEQTFSTASFGQLNDELDAYAPQAYSHPMHTVVETFVVPAAVAALLDRG